MSNRICLIALLLSACGPSEPRQKCTYAEIEGTCALVEATDFEPTAGSPGRIRVRYRLIQDTRPELGNHVVLMALSDPDHHQQALKYFNARNSVACTVGVRAQAATTCPELRVRMALPPPPEELKLTYEARVVADKRARPEEEEPFGGGKSTPWP